MRTGVEGGGAFNPPRYLRRVCTKSIVFINNLLTLKRLGLLPNKRGWGATFISACSVVANFSGSKYFVIRYKFCKKSKQFDFNCLN